MKIFYQGLPGAYSHLAALENYPKAEIILNKIVTHILKVFL